MQVPTLTFIFGVLAFVSQVFANALPGGLASSGFSLTRRQDTVPNCASACEPWNAVVESCLAVEVPPKCFCTTDNSPAYKSCVECQLGVFAMIDDAESIEIIAAGFQELYGVLVNYCTNIEGIPIPPVTITRPPAYTPTEEPPAEPTPAAEEGETGA